MSFQLVVNIFLAFLWMLLRDSWSGLDFLTGYLVGLLLVFGMRRFYSTPFYMRRVLALGRLMVLFIKELVQSSMFVIRQILSPRMTFIPGIFKLDTRLEGDWEITVLCLLITLTPGSVVVETGPEQRCLYIHAMDVEAARHSLIHTVHAYEQAIMGVTRDVF